MSGWFGARIARLEDAELVSGAARYVDDLPIQGAAHLVVARSPIAHGRILDIDLGATRPGVLAAWTAQDIPGLSWPQVIEELPRRRPLAEDKVRYQGEPVAAIVAETPSAGWDARDDVWVDLDPREAVVDPEAALQEDAPLVYEELGTNVGYRSGGGFTTDLFAGADVVVRRTFRNHRVAPGMLEARAFLAAPTPAGLTVHCSHQAPHRLRDQLAGALGMPPGELRVVVPEVGGGFGAKGAFYPEYLLAAHAARVLGRPVKYVETRSENLQVTTHGRAQSLTVELGASRHGELMALRVRSLGDLGAAVDNQRWCLFLTELMLSGCYRLPRIEREILGVFTNTAPVGAFRGAGRPEAIYAVERAMDVLARDLDIDPVELRARNLIPPEDFPYDTGLRSVYDSGDYPTALRIATERIGYRDLRSRQRPSDGSGAPVIGVGVACYVELSGGGEEYGEVVVGPDGSVRALTGTSPHGQGHRTAWGQIVADELGLSPQDVTVVHGDTLLVHRGGGTSGSRSAPVGGSSLGIAAHRMADRLRGLAADRLEAAESDVLLQGGKAVVAGTDVGVSFAELASSAGGELRAEEVFAPSGLVYPFGCHICVVEVDRETGEVRVLRYVAVDDCGRVINPVLTEGQIHGGILQGVSYALQEEVRHDEAGNLLTGNWMTYLLPTVDRRVEPDAVRSETPSSNNPLGVKGVGEAGTTGATPAVANAVVDALTRLGIDDADLDMPFTPSKVWTALNRRRRG